MSISPYSSFNPTPADTPRTNFKNSPPRIPPSFLTQQFLKVFDSINGLQEGPEKEIISSLRDVIKVEHFELNPLGEVTRIEGILLKLNNEISQKELDRYRCEQAKELIEKTQLILNGIKQLCPTSPPPIVEEESQLIRHCKRLICEQQILNEQHEVELADLMKSLNTFLGNRNKVHHLYLLIEDSNGKWGDFIEELNKHLNKILVIKASVQNINLQKTDVRVIENFVRTIENLYPINDESNSTKFILFGAASLSSHSQPIKQFTNLLADIRIPLLYCWLEGKLDTTSRFYMSFYQKDWRMRNNKVRSYLANLQEIINDIFVINYAEGYQSIWKKASFPPFLVNGINSDLITPYVISEGQAQAERLAQENQEAREAIARLSASRRSSHAYSHSGDNFPLRGFEISTSYITRGNRDEEIIAALKEKYDEMETNNAFWKNFCGQVPDLNVLLENYRLVKKKAIIHGAEQDLLRLDKKYLTLRQIQYLFRSKKSLSRKEGLNYKHQRILITGECGSGKNIFLRSLVKQWAREKLWEDHFVAVFFLCSSELPKIERNKDLAHKNQLIGWIRDQWFKDKKFTLQEIEDFIDRNKNSIVLMIDNFSGLIPLIPETTAHGSTIDSIFSWAQAFGHWIFASPAHKAYSILKHFDKNYELTGLTWKGIKNYIQQFFDYDQRGENLILQVQRHPHLIGILSHSPYLWSLCSLWENGGSLNFEELRCTSLLKQVDVNLDNKPDIQEFLEKMSKSCMDEKRLIFDTSSLQKFVDEKINHKSLEDRLQYISSINEIQNHPWMKVIIRDEKSISTNHYSFSHSYFRDFFVAKYLLRGLLTDGRACELIQKQKYNPHYLSVFSFLFGLIKEDIPEPKKMFSKLFALIKPKVDSISLYNFLLFVRSIEEYDSSLIRWKPVVYTEIKKWTERAISLLFNPGYGSFLFSQMSLTPQICEDIILPEFVHILSDNPNFALKIEVISYMRKTGFCSLDSSLLAIKEVIEKYISTGKRNQISFILEVFEELAQIPSDNNFLEAINKWREVLENQPTTPFLQPPSLQVTTNEFNWTSVENLFKEQKEDSLKLSHIKNFINQLQRKPRLESDNIPDFILEILTVDSESSDIRCKLAFLIGLHGKWCNSNGPKIKKIINNPAIPPQTRGCLLLSLAERKVKWAFKICSRILDHCSSQTVELRAYSAFCLGFFEEQNIEKIGLEILERAEIKVKVAFLKALRKMKSIPGPIITSLLRMWSQGIKSLTDQQECHKFEVLLIQTLARLTSKEPLQYKGIDWRTEGRFLTLFCYINLCSYELGFETIHKLMKLPNSCKYLLSQTPLSDILEQANKHQTDIIELIVLKCLTEGLEIIPLTDKMQFYNSYAEEMVEHERIACLPSDKNSSKSILKHFFFLILREEFRYIFLTGENYHIAFRGFPVKESIFDIFDYKQKEIEISFVHNTLCTPQKEEMEELFKGFVKIINHFWKKEISQVQVDNRMRMHIYGSVKFLKSFYEKVFEPFCPTFK